MSLSYENDLSAIIDVAASNMYAYLPFVWRFAIYQVQTKNL